jgi:hypothetical protein
MSVLCIHEHYVSALNTRKFACDKGLLSPVNEHYGYFATQLSEYRILKLLYDTGMNLTVVEGNVTFKIKVNILRQEIR